MATGDGDYARQVATIRAAWYLNKTNPTRAEEDEYRDKGFDTKDGFFAALALLREAVGVIEMIEVGDLPPSEKWKATAIVRAYDAATRPVERAGSNTIREGG